MIRLPSGFGGGVRIKRRLDYYQASAGVDALQILPFGANTSGGDLLGSAPAGLAVKFDQATPNLVIRDPLGALNYQGLPFVADSGKISFSRASSATYYNSSGTLISAATDVPRLTYNPGTLAAQGLLVEPQKDNIVLYSEDLRNTAAAGSSRPWTWNQATVTANNTTAPDGTVTADLIVSSGSFPIVFQPVSITGTMTYSTFLKDGTSGQAVLRVTGTGVGGGSNTEIIYRFTFATQTLARVQGGTAISSGVQSLPSSWFRVWITFNVTTATNVAIYPRYSDATAANVNVWGVQLESGNITNYIPTTATLATRQADLPTIATSLFPYSNGSGTLIAWWAHNGTPASTQTAASLDDGSAANVVSLQSTASNRQGLLTVSNANIFTISTTAASGSNNNVLGLTYQSGSSQAALAGTSIGTSANTYTPPTFSALRLGYEYNNTQQVNGVLKQIVFIPSKISSSDLIARCT